MKINYFFNSKLFETQAVNLNSKTKYFRQLENESKIGKIPKNFFLIFAHPTVPLSASLIQFCIALSIVEFHNIIKVQHRHKMQIAKQWIYLFCGDDVGNAVLREPFVIGLAGKL